MAATEAFNYLAQSTLRQVSDACLVPHLQSELGYIHQPKQSLQVQLMPSFLRPIVVVECCKHIQFMRRMFPSSFLLFTSWQTI